MDNCLCATRLFPLLASVWERLLKAPCPGCFSMQGSSVVKTNYWKQKNYWNDFCSFWHSCAPIIVQKACFLPLARILLYVRVESLALMMIMTTVGNSSFFIMRFISFQLCFCQILRVCSFWSSSREKMLDDIVRFLLEQKLSWLWRCAISFLQEEWELSASAKRSLEANILRRDWRAQYKSSPKQGPGYWVEGEFMHIFSSIGLGGHESSSPNQRDRVNSSLTITDNEWMKKSERAFCSVDVIIMQSCSLIKILLQRKVNNVLRFSSVILMDLNWWFKAK